MDKHAPALLTLAEVADRLAVSERHVRRLVFERRIPFIKWGHLLRFDPLDVEAWIAASKITQSEERREDLRRSNGYERATS